MLRIATLNEHERMSTRELLRLIAKAVENGEKDFYINASGQHDIGGALWSPDGSMLNFEVYNPGQRVGGMCMPGTRIVVNGPVPADAGWLNSGGEIVIKGDAGDTTGHCAAGGKIYVGGRSGTRTGSLMKHDPQCEPPELWILKNTGSFSFEFMGGGKAIVCGSDCMSLPTPLGERPCVGMVGGTVYFRGGCPQLPDDVELADLSDEDIQFLDAGLDEFLAAIGKEQLKRHLGIWKHWRKLEPCLLKKSEQRISMRDFRQTQWFANGLFNDVLSDDFVVAPLPATGCLMLRQPVWQEQKCVDCRRCLKNCPQHAIKRRGAAESFSYEAAAKSCIGCGICEAVCPEGSWRMEEKL